VSRQLQNIYGHKGFDVKSLYRHMQFATLFPDSQIVSTASRQLSWSHFVELLPLKDELQRDYYFTLASANRWSVRQLRKEIDGMLYERTALSSKPEEVVKQELANVRDNKVVSPDVVFKSPYFLEFTGLKGLYSEKDLEDSLVAHLEQFILELGNGFCFVERQKRMIIDGEDFYLDLLFYHRKLHRLIAIDLKLGRFKAQYKGQHPGGRHRFSVPRSRDDRKRQQVLFRQGGRRGASEGIGGCRERDSERAAREGRRHNREAHVAARRQQGSELDRRRGGIRSR
jgi:predicted nuclease of restriction endonuclease-like (RecB) superfamily